MTKEFRYRVLQIQLEQIMQPQKSDLSPVLSDPPGNLAELSKETEQPGQK